jgi:transcriptional regulator with XRE-family HTH domain
MDDTVAQGVAIKRLRGSRSQTEVARRAGIPRSVWNRYERGKRLATEDARRKIALGLGCTLLELEREIWEVRQKRLAAEEAAASTVEEEAGEYHVEPADEEERPADRLLREIREHTNGLARHLEALVLLLLRNPSS